MMLLAGSVASGYNLAFTHNTVHCRKRHSDLGRLKEPSTSANVYWQFEKESDGRSGEPLFWGERCRIKHLPTRRYLAVVCDLHKKGTYNVSYEGQPVYSYVRFCWCWCRWHWRRDLFQALLVAVTQIWTLFSPSFPSFRCVNFITSAKSSIRLALLLFLLHCRRMRPSRLSPMPASNTSRLGLGYIWRRVCLVQPWSVGLA